MLGLCWTPATVSNMQKVASTMPSDHEQLLGAILVRKDIFQRFENTMHDTCLDANNLLEYLFSLYNSTATPSERENFPSPQSFNLMRRGPKPGKKSGGRIQPIFGQQPGNMGNNSHLSSLPSQQNQRLGLSAGAMGDGHSKKIKMDPLNYPVGVGGGAGVLGGGPGIFAGQMQQHADFTGFQGGGAAGNSSVKMEHIQAEMESQQAQHLHGHAASPLPPFSQLRRQGSQPYSPAAAQFSDVTPLKNHMGAEGGLVDPGNASGTMGLQGSAGMDASDSQDMDDIQVTGTPDGTTEMEGDGEVRRGRRGRKKRTHQCFCGALFTRADNLKRHIRKCHEEKLEKLSGAPAEFELEGGGEGGGSGTDAAQGFSSGGQQGELASPVHSQFLPGDQQQQQQHEDAQHHPHQNEMQQQQQHHHHHHQQQQQFENNGASNKGVRWSCFCGESFDDHRQLVEHTRTHENNT